MATAATARVRIAILPFENLSPDSADAFFADGMHEEVLNSLAGRTQNIDVISRATMMSYRNAKQSPRDIARALSASHLLAGTVRREGTHVRISVTLIDGANDNLLWSQRFDRELNDAMTLQSEVAGSVAERLAVRFVSGPGTLPPSRNAQAYDLWLRGVLAWQNGASGPGRPVEEMQRVEDLYSQAIELDPDFAAAYADRARVRSQFYISGWDVSDANLDEARADLAVARRLAGDAPHVLVREATFVALIDDDIKGSLEKFARAEAVGPLTADFLMSKANFLRLAGRIDEALAADANAARLDPANPTISIFWMRNLLSVRRFAEATQVADAFEQRVPGSIERGESIFAYTGSTARWRAEVELQKGGDSLLGLSSEAALMRVEGHSAELLQRLEALGDATYRQRPSLGFLIAATPVPIAELRGWERLLAGDSVAAAREGRRLLDFLAKQPLPRRSVWWPKLLGAEGALFVGDRRRAIADARAVLATAGNSPHIAIALHSRARVARILAWAGEKEAAIALLEELSAPALSMGPAEVTRDPLFVKPLEGEPRYKALRARLENEIAVNARAL
jgi:TolB-like protein